MQCFRGSVIFVAMLISAITPVLAQEATLVGRVAVEDRELRKTVSSAGVVVWLEPMQSGETFWHPTQRPYTLKQKNHTFDPHVLIIPVGSRVQFPNEDDVFHNAFSLFRGKRFDLGLYESGDSREVRFDKPGVSYIFCNIHSQMGAVVVALPAPYYGVSDRDGRIRIEHVPSGSYRLNLWAEGASDETLDDLARVITIADTTDCGIIHIRVTPPVDLTHTNKFGHPYDPNVNSYSFPTS